MKISPKIYYVLFILVAISCEKGNTEGFLSPAIKYPSTSINASIGTSLIQSGAMVTDESTKPLEFSIEAIHNEDGSIATKLMGYKVETYFFNGEYTDTIPNRKELDAVRMKVTRPAIDINPENGNILIYPEARDTVLLPKGKYILDVKVKNSAEERIIKGAITINVTPYTLPYFYKFSGVDGNLTGIDVTFTQLETTGNKIRVIVLKKDGTRVDPKTIFGFESVVGISDKNEWKYLGLGNPTKYTEYPDRLELEVDGFPIPAVIGKVRTIDMANKGSVNGKYFNYWFTMAIYKEGYWEVVIKLNYN